MRTTVCALVALLLSGCAAGAIQVNATENPDIHAELLFTHDGCRIYRFRDGLQAIYYADCRDGSGGAASASTAWRVSCGRNCTRPVMVTTAMH